MFNGFAISNGSPFVEYNDTGQFYSRESKSYKLLLTDTLLTAQVSSRKLTCWFLSRC